jgi:peptide-methionine (S)-S-oxide reductase
MSRLIRNLLAVAVVLGVVFYATTLLPPAQAQSPILVPAPSVDAPRTGGSLQTVVLAGGCFWGMQGVFEHVRGVRQVLAGYAGGERNTATYDLVSTGSTGHAESVQIAFDPSQVSLGELLRIYFSVAHDPTELNRQGPDEGSQYRSEIFFADETQRSVAQTYIAQLDKARVFSRPIVTQLESLKGFYEAEAYHQDYLIKNPNSPYIVYNDLPKIRNLQRLFPTEYQGRPVQVPQASQ